ncbi:MAG: LamG domain-containing protein [Candidatus Methylacidiphilales bacterium]
MPTQAVAPESLAGWWQLNATNELTAADRSSNNLALTLTTVNGSLVPPGAVAEGGTIWRPALYDNGADLQGAYYFTAQANAAYALTDFTFSAWVKTAPASDYQVVALYKDTANFGWQVDTAPNGQARLRWDTAAGANQVVQSATVQTVVKDSAWHQVGVTFTASTGLAQLFVDGRLEASRVIAGSFGPTIKDFRIGDAGYGVAWKGMVDEVRLYKKALSATEVASLPATYFDQDDDGLDTLHEMLLGTHPLQRDTDADGLPDGAEAALGLNATNAADASLLGTSGLTRLQEYRFGLDAANATTGGAVAPTRLVGYWPFELNGTNASPQIANPNYVFDHSVSALPGRLVGVSVTDRAQAFGAGKVGTALVLNGSPFVEVKPSAAVLGDYTVAAWVKTSNTASSNSIFQWQDANGLGFEIG